MDQANSAVANKNAVAKRKFITAFFDDAEKRAVYLLDLHANGRATEAATLCLVYIDSFSQWLCWPRSRSGRNFVEALVDHGGDPEFALIHPLAAIRAFETMKEQWKNFATKLRSHFPGPEYSLFEKGDFLTEVAADFTEPEANLFGVELWRGTIANVVYSRLRNPSVHSTRSSTFMRRITIAFLQKIWPSTFIPNWAGIPPFPTLERTCGVRLSAPCQE
jgi:hypothetical protein